MIVPLTKVQLRQDEDGVWIAKSGLLPGCHAHGRDRGEASLRFQQAAKVHLEALLETGRPIPAKSEAGTASRRPRHHSRRILLRQVLAR